jgi:hypothetical protein
MAEIAQQDRPKMLIAIDHLDQAFDQINAAMNTMSSWIYDLQRVADYVARNRDGMIQTVEEMGGDVTASIEHQIRDFIPKSRKDDGNGNGSRSSKKAVQPTVKEE